MVLAVTVTVKVSVAVEVPSLACKVKVAFDAPQLAAMSAVILPPVLTMFEIVTPLAGLADVTITATLPLPPSSVTVAICELLPEPCGRDKPVVAAIVGGKLGRLHCTRRIETVLELVLATAKS